MTLINIAKGDAYGAGFEFYRSKDVKRKHKMSNYVQSHFMKDSPPGTVTDDTQMSMAIADLMIEGGDWSDSPRPDRARLHRSSALALKDALKV